MSGYPLLGNVSIKLLGWLPVIDAIGRAEELVSRLSSEQVQRLCVHLLNCRCFDSVTILVAGEPASSATQYVEATCNYTMTEREDPIMQSAIAAELGDAFPVSREESEILFSPCSFLDLVGIDKSECRVLSRTGDRVVPDTGEAMVLARGYSFNVFQDWGYARVALCLPDSEVCAKSLAVSE